jgi:hypothetical protein
LWLLIENLYGNRRHTVVPIGVSVEIGTEMLPLSNSTELIEVLGDYKVDEHRLDA